ncbi:MAG: LuxR family transcriptional regulator [Nitrospirae bacterium]|nr:MAG: LuxR family transcriptional regulator [Nitrospirota bacterium]
MRTRKKKGQAMEPLQTTESLPFLTSDIDVLTALEQKGLTKREIQVLEWVARGKTNSEIGMILQISPRTASKHLEHIYTKLGVESRTAAVVVFLEMLQESGQIQKAKTRHPPPPYS